MRTEHGGLFSFLRFLHYAGSNYNDFAVTSMLLAEEKSHHGAPITTPFLQIRRFGGRDNAAFLGTTYTEGNVMFAVSAVVSATVPLFILVMFFQRQIVSGLVDATHGAASAGAVKG